MFRKITAAVLAAVALTTAGCTTETVGHALPAPHTTTQQPPSTEPAPEPVADDSLDTIYLQVVSTEIPDATDTDLLTAGQAVCMTLDDTPAPTQATLVGIATGITDNFPWSWQQAGFVMGAAITAWCPTYSYLIG